MVNRVATFSFSDSMVAGNMRLQSKYADINTQISSGLKTQDYKGIAGDAQYLLAVESAQSKLDAYNANGNNVLATMNTMYATLGRVDDLANSMLQTITASLGGNQVPSAILASQGSNALNEMQGLLNLKIAGRYVFAGSDIDTKPVDITAPAWPVMTPPSVANTGYYKGNSVTNTVQISETLTLNYGVKADNPAFENLLRAYNLVFNNPGNAAALTEASGLIQQGVAANANVRALISTQAKSIENQVDKNTQDKGFMGELTSSIKETDIPSASVKLTEIQSQLEAAYASSVRILNLSLTNYLR